MATITGNGVLVGTTDTDTITGGTGPDILIGEAGTDTLRGGDGDDVLAPDDYVGDYYWYYYDAAYYYYSRDDGVVDHVDGGAGYDRVAMRFDNVTANITANFSNAAVSQNLAGSTVVNVEEFQMVLGSGNDNVTLGLGNDQLLGMAGNDTLNGGAGNDYLHGGDGGDTLGGGDGSDNVYGEAGDDRLSGGAGTDWLDGGEGNDTVVLTGARADYAFEAWYGSVKVTNTVTGEIDYVYMVETFEFSDQSVSSADIFTSVVNGTFAGETLYGSYVADEINGFAGNDVLYGFEDDDVLNGGVGNDQIYGHDGDDQLNGGSGDDLLHAGTGNDIINGGEGNDRAVLTFASMTAGVTYAVGDGTILTSAGTVTITSIEAAQIDGSAFDDHFTGGSWNDTLYGNAGNDLLEGLGGNDQLRGGSGADTLNGGDGNDYLDGGLYYSGGDDNGDVLNGGAGDDYLIGGYGDDTLDGGEGTDRTELQFYNSTSGVTYALNDGAIATDQGIKTLFNIESATMNGSRYDDVLTGGAGNDNLQGNDGNDTLSGLGGDDFINGGNGNDSLDGGDGIDRTYLSFETASTGVTYALNDGSVLTRFGTKTLSNFEGADMYGSSYNDNLTGGSGYDFIWGSFGDDVINGGGGNDRLHGADGADTIDGGDGDDFIDGGQSYYYGDGNDILRGGAGDDTIYSGWGDDILDGGDGIDRTRLEFSNGINGAGVTYTLNDGAVVTYNGTKTLSNFEGADMYGSQYDDVLTGGSARDQLYGQNGNDTLSGLGGDDHIDGGAGDDILDGGDGVDTVQLEFYNIAGGVTYTLGDGTVATYYGTKTLSNFEAAQMYGSQFDDNLTGGSGADVIHGREGNDTLSGLGGNDRLYAQDSGTSRLIGGEGDDLLYGNGGSTTAVYSGPRSQYSFTVNANGTITITDNAGNDGADTLQNISHLEFSDGTWTLEQLLSNSAPAAPVDADSATADRLAENATGGTYAGVTLQSADTDGDTLAYSLTDDAGGRFRVDAATGAVVATGAVNINYENAPFSDANGRYYEVTGVATDPDGAVSEPTTYRIYVTNVVESPFAEGGDGSAAQPVDFNTMGAGAYEPDGEAQYFGLGGDDYVILPDQATVASGRNPWDYFRTFQAGEGNDMVQGADGNDIVAGDAGNDRLFGDAGNDQLLGGTGNDVLGAGAGTDRLTGGEGRDIFLFTDSELGSSRFGAHDVITDFTQGTDLIDISALYDGGPFAGFKFGKLSSALKNGAPVDAYKVGYYGDGVSIWIQGDNSGDGIADFTIELSGARALAGTPAAVSASFIVDAAGWNSAMANAGHDYDWASHHRDGIWL